MDLHHLLCYNDLIISTDSINTLSLSLSLSPCAIQTKLGPINIINSAMKSAAVSYLMPTHVQPFYSTTTRTHQTAAENRRLSRDFIHPYIHPSSTFPSRLLEFLFDLLENLQSGWDLGVVEVGIQAMGCGAVERRLAVMGWAD